MITFQSNDTRLERIARHAFGAILDIGYAQYPNEYLRGDVTGLDLKSPRVKPPNYRGIIRGDATKVLRKIKGKTYNTIIASEFIEHIDNHKKFFDDCFYLLKDNGLLILSTPTPYYYRTLLGNVLFQRGSIGNREHISVYIPRIMNAVADEAGFDLVTIEPATTFYVPFLTYQMIYVYRKRGKHANKK
jgi:SAM-dependent methyltransferase